MLEACRKSGGGQVCYSDCVTKCQHSQLPMLIMLYMKRKHLCAPHLVQCSMPVQGIKGDRRVSERKSAITDKLYMQ